MLWWVSACGPTQDSSVSSTRAALRNFAFRWAQDAQSENPALLKHHLAQDASMEAIKLVECLALAHQRTLSISFDAENARPQRNEQGDNFLVLPFSLTGPHKIHHKSELTIFVEQDALGDYKITHVSDDVRFHLSSAERELTRIQQAQTFRSVREEKLSPGRLEVARQRIRSSYDSVVYYTLVDTTLLFYVVNGDWQYPMVRNQDQALEYRMGVVSEYGKEIIPVSFDKIYNPGGTIDGLIEVERNGRRGLYTLSGQPIVSPTFEALYPFEGDPEVLVQVKLGGRFGWIDRDGKLYWDPASHPDARLFASPITRDRVLAWKYDIYQPGVSYLGHPYSDHDQFIGGGIVVAPSYLNDLGIVPEYNWNISTEDMPQEYRELDENYVTVVSLTSITRKIKGLISLFFESGIDARDYAFRKNTLVTLNEQAEAVGSVEFNGSFHYHLADPERPFQGATLFEVRENKHNDYAPYDEMTVYSYYQIDADGKITELKTPRLFSFTKFVRISEENFRGEFRKFIETAQNSRGQHVNLVTTDHLSLEDLDVMRNEIFAEYGYRFQSEKWQRYFRQQPWYSPQHDNVDDKLSETDRYNVQFIHNFQRKMSGHEAEYIQRDSALYMAAG